MFDKRGGHWKTPLVLLDFTTFAVIVKKHGCQSKYHVDIMKGKHNNLGK